MWTGVWGTPGTLQAGEQDIPCCRSEGLIWLAFTTPEINTIQAPDWTNQLLGVVPLHAALAGPEDGYLIVETQLDTDLRAIPGPGDALAAHTRRALVLTCQSSPGRSPENIHYRYFAPQYGNPEDTATGSAMRVLSAYWQDRGLGPELTALQCSPAGGWLHSRFRNNRTWVGGRVAAVTGDSEA